MHAPKIEISTAMGSLQKHRIHNHMLCICTVLFENVFGLRLRAWGFRLKVCTAHLHHFHYTSSMSQGQSAPGLPSTWTDHAHSMALFRTSAWDMPGWPGCQHCDQLLGPGPCLWTYVPDLPPLVVVDGEAIACELWQEAPCSCQLRVLVFELVQLILVAWCWRPSKKLITPHPGSIMARTGRGLAWAWPFSFLALAATEAFRAAASSSTRSPSTASAFSGVRTLSISLGALNVLSFMILSMPNELKPGSAHVTSNFTRSFSKVGLLPSYGTALSCASRLISATVKLPNAL